ncbi:hypothetical protein [Paucibacter sp. PLA-PC-4]|uniref:hypothetical protein n=1 Tax=Paucibacter sp. PLA-PC-4 TaxID=2993655 RepID=UPI003A4C5DD6
MNRKLLSRFHVPLLMALATAAALYSSCAGAASGVALVLQDQVALRGAARESAPAQAQLWRGEALEIRGERLDYYQVYDYRRERGGYVRKTQLMRTGTRPTDAADLLAALSLVRHQPGAEALGLGLAAAYVQAAPAQTLAGAAGAQALEAMGSLAERLADRVSTPVVEGQVLSKNAEAVRAAQLDVAARYGLHFTSHEGVGGTRLCYEGEMFRRVMAIAAAAPEQRVRAALALTRPDCQPAELHPREREQQDGWRAEVLELVDGDSLPTHWKNRLLMRRAGVWSSLAFARSRRGDAAAAKAASERALAEFAAIKPAELAEDDGAAYNDAAMRTNAQRWAVQPVSATMAGLVVSVGAEGETCVAYGNARRCTWGQVWPASARINREGTAIALAVQPLDGWTELWLLRLDNKAWRIDVLPPAAAAPGLGYAEFAGWVPGGRQLLVAREARAEGRYKRSYELLNLDGLAAERQAGDARLLGAFQRWQDRDWRRLSLSMR